ncbi:SH3 domain-containing protein, partial [Rhizobiaceae sp. 2RAB30]
MRRLFLGAFATLMLSLPAGPSLAQETAAPTATESAPPGPSGGFFVVQGIADGDLLNVRAAASGTGKLVGRVPNGAALRNQGCSETNGVTWCKVESVEDASVTGWAPARYLVDVPMDDVGS